MDQIPLGEVHHITEPPVEGDPLLTAPADSCLQHPDFRYEAEQFGVVAIAGFGDVLKMLLAIDGSVRAAIERFESLR